MPEFLETMDGMSMDIEQQNRERLRAVFPECYTEGKLDIDKLLALCGTYTDSDFEKYRFEWKGKAECLKLAQLRSAGTLRPCPEESVDWETTRNLYIEGDNLEVLKLMQTTYFRKIKMIYIDPPYNTGNDFVYEDDFADPISRYREVTAQTTKSNPETMGRYHTNWLNMIYPRLRLAANLLREDGVIFISIDDNEYENLKKICNEVFGEENYLGTFIWKRRQMVDSRTKTGVSEDHEYCLCYSKQGWRIRGKSPDMSKYSNPDNDPNGDWMSSDMTGLATASQRPNLHYDLVDPDTGIVYKCPPTGWRYEKSRMNELLEKHEIIFPKDPNGRPRRKKYVKDLSGEFAGFSTILDTVYNTQATRELRQIFDDNEYFDFPKPVDLIKLLILQGTTPTNTDEPIIILDFFSGSATTAHAVMQLNAEDGGSRQFIMVQLPEVCGEKSEAFKAGYHNICEIGKERIRRAGRKILSEMSGQTSLTDSTEIRVPNTELDIGFRVFKLDTSNLRSWDTTPILPEQLDILTQRMNGMIDRVKSDRSDIDMVCEIMLKSGIPLTYSIEQVAVNGKTAYSIGEDCLLLVCLEKSIAPEDVEAFSEYEPAKMVFSRDSFPDDTAMANAYYILRDREIEMKLV